MSATITFNDIWAGPVAIEVRSFRTKRRGETVKRFRLERMDGQHGCSSVFTSPEAALAHAKRDQRFTVAA